MVQVVVVVVMAGGRGRQGEEHRKILLQQRSGSQAGVQRRQRGREDAEGGRWRRWLPIVGVLEIGGCGRRSREEERAYASFLPEVVVDPVDDVVDEDSPLQVQVGAHPRSVQLHEGHVEDGLTLKSEGRLRHADDTRRTSVFLQTVLILVQFPLHPVTQHKSAEERETETCKVSF